MAIVFGSLINMSKTICLKLNAISPHLFDEKDFRIVIGIFLSENSKKLILNKQINAKSRSMLNF